MADFYEIWDLRNRLIKDGHYSSTTNENDGRAEELRIWKLAREHYGWEPPEPKNEHKPGDKYRDFLELMTANTRLGHIYDIAIDWDGYRSVRSLGNLVDEIITCTIPKCVTDHDALEQARTAGLYDGVEDFLNRKVKELPFSWNFFPEDFARMEKWCMERGYEVKNFVVNYSSAGEVISYAGTIENSTESST